MPIKWRDELSIDHGAIDQDHQTLFSIINGFEAIQPGPQQAAELDDVLGKLERYATVHFEREEALQRKVSFPYAQGHNQQHRHLLRSLAAARAEFAAAGSDKALADFHAHMSGFLHDWLVDHIVQTDLAMKPYVRAMAPHAELIGSLHAAVRAMAG